MREPNHGERSVCLLTSGNFFLQILQNIRCIKIVVKKMFYVIEREKKPLL